MTAENINLKCRLNDDTSKYMDLDCINFVKLKIRAIPLSNRLIINMEILGTFFKNLLKNFNAKNYI